MWKSLPYKNCIYFSVGLNIISAVSILILKNILPPVVPIFYGLPSGAEQLTPVIGLILAPATGLLITITNIFASNLTKDIFIKKTLMISSAFISLLLAITITKVIFLVGFF